MSDNEKIVAALLRLGTNNWLEEDNHESATCPLDLYSPKLRCDRALWEEYIHYIRKKGINTLLIDLGDGIRYESHPELAVDGAWTIDEMKSELSRLRELGLEVIPMLNFSGAHDIWLGDYAHMISTVPYYRVCADLIDEVCGLFDSKYVHIGMDSETFDTQKPLYYTAVRHKELWWHDLYFFTDRILGNGARAIIYADRLREVGEKAFFEGLPQSVAVSVNCADADAAEMIRMIGEKGYDQLPISEKPLDNTVSDGHFLGRIAINDVVLDESRRDDIFSAAYAVTV